MPRTRTQFRENAMPVDTLEAKAHELLGQLGPGKLAAVVHLLEVMIDDEEEELTEDDRIALRASDEYFRKGGQGIPFEQVVADLGFTMEQIRGAKSK
jgi:hypothetical protein